MEPQRAVPSTGKSSEKHVPQRLLTGQCEIASGAKPLIGEVVYLYAFDVANEILTARVQQILSEKAFPFEIRMDRTLPKDMPLYKPLAIQPEPLKSRLRGFPVRLLIRVYDVGVVTVMMRVRFEAETLAELTPLHNPRLDSGDGLDGVASRLCANVCESLKDSHRGGC